MKPINSEVRRELIIDCKSDIANLESKIAYYESRGSWCAGLRSLLHRQQIALTALEAQPDNWVVSYADGRVCSNWATEEAAERCAKQIKGTYAPGKYSHPAVPALTVIQLPRLIFSATTKGEREEMMDVRNDDIKAIRDAGYEVVDLTTYK